MNEEIKSLIEDAAKLLGLEGYAWEDNPFQSDYIKAPSEEYELSKVFNPLDPERGDLMKVAMAAKLFIDYENGLIGWPADAPVYQTKDFEPNNYQSLALAVLRAASAVLHSHGEG